MDVRTNEPFSTLFGGVVRNEGVSGVPERLRPSISFRKRAAKLLVDDTASAWHVAWYI